MADAPVPRYFVRANASSIRERAVDPAAVLHAVDLLRIGARHLVDREWIAAMDASSAPMLVPAERRGALPLDVQEQLSHHEVAGGGRVRRYDAQRLWLFFFQLAEQPGEATGLNDPIYLYGTLAGPFPRGEGESTPVCEGQLTVTRADVLAGYVAGAPWVFQYPGSAGGAMGKRCHHLLLPGGRAEEIDGGDGLVLAFPMLPVEVSLEDAGNEILVNQLVYDVLAALQDDLRKHRAGGAFASKLLPVPSRPAFVSRLEAEGFRVSGDSATRSRVRGRGIFAAIARLFFRETRPVPREGTSGDYLELARAALATVPGWPDARARALAARLGEGSAPRAEVRASPAPGAPIARPRVEARTPDRGDWMKDFLDAHKKPGASAKVTSAAQLLAASDRPEWMRDFETKSSAAAPRRDPPKGRETSDWRKDFERRNEPEKKKPEPGTPGKKPDWMKDFE